MLSVSFIVVCLLHVAASTDVCNNDCTHSSDTDCDDGGVGAQYAYCSFGSDCDDCGSRSTPTGVCTCDDLTTFIDNNKATSSDLCSIARADCTNTFQLWSCSRSSINGVVTYTVQCTVGSTSSSSSSDSSGETPTTSDASDASDASCGGTSMAITSQCCYDGSTPYPCQATYSCGRGQCIPAAHKLCTDGPTPNTDYICAATFSCGRGVCVPATYTLCGTSGTTTCAATYTCCGTSPETKDTDMTCYSAMQNCPVDRRSSTDYDSTSAEYSPSTSAGGDDPCFPSSATVTLANGQSVRVDTLTEGAAIVAATADGKITTDTVSVVSIAKPEAEATFVSILTDAGKILNLTAEHHIPVGEECCTTLKKAKDLNMGETVYAAVDKNVAATTVVKKWTSVHRGLHSPVLTAGNFPIVDGIVTSFDAMPKVTLASYGLPMLSKVCKLTGMCETFRNTLV